MRAAALAARPRLETSLEMELVARPNERDFKKNG
jgi:hypothetical protein